MAAASRSGTGVAAALCAAALAVSGSAQAGGAAGHQTFAAAGRQAVATVLGVWAAGPGLWRACNAPDCEAGNRDWGDDSLTYVLALRYSTTHDASLLAPLRALTASAPAYPAACATPDGCASWSDVPEWDAIALADEYEATGDPAAVAK